MSAGHSEIKKINDVCALYIQYKAAITGRRLQGRRAVESGIGRYTNYRQGKIRVTSGNDMDTL